MNWQPQTERIAEDVLDVVLAHNGLFAGEPGYVLAGLADWTGHDYKEVSRAVLYLEAEGLVEVERMTHKEARRANRIAAVRAL